MSLPPAGARAPCMQASMPACMHAGRCPHACMHAGICTNLHAGRCLHACMPVYAAKPTCMQGARAPAGGSHSGAPDVASMFAHKYSFCVADI